MKPQIFFSWQSDIDNRNNIEEALKKALKSLKMEPQYELNYSIDKDTKGFSGSPDIVNTILGKISKCEIFIADVTIINKKNNKYKSRLTPNPNVLFELGYAVGKIGWDRIICILNSEHGGLEELPFDIKGRRVLSYKNDKLGKLAEELQTGINEIARFNLKQYNLKIFYKLKIDLELFRVLKFFEKILNGIKSNLKTQELIKYFQRLKRKSLKEQFTNQSLLAYQYRKSIHKSAKELEDIISKPLVREVFDSNSLSTLINLIRVLNIYEDSKHSFEFDGGFFDGVNVSNLQIEETDINNYFKLIEVSYSDEVDGQLRETIDEGYFDIFMHEAYLHSYVKFSKPDLHAKIIIRIKTLFFDWIDQTGNHLMIKENRIKV